jgi:hypothetical protein
MLVAGLENPDKRELLLVPLTATPEDPWGERKERERGRDGGRDGDRERERQRERR